jgi:hypothetical protein
MKRYTGRDGYFMAVFDIANAVAALWEAETAGLNDQLAAEHAARQAAEQERDTARQQIAALREVLSGMLESYDLVMGTELAFSDLTRSMFRVAFINEPERARALLATPSAEPDDEIRMPIQPGIPGVGVVVSAGPRPELVIEDEQQIQRPRLIREPDESEPYHGPTLVLKQPLRGAKQITLSPASDKEQQPGDAAP